MAVKRASRAGTAPAPAPAASNVSLRMQANQTLHAMQGQLVARSLRVVGGIVLLIIAHLVAKLAQHALLSRKINANVTSDAGGARDAASQGSKAALVHAANVQRNQRQTNLIYLTLSTLIYYAIMLVAALLVLRLVGVEAASIIALVGAVGLGVGLALQGVLSDLSSGIVLTWMQIYAIGDVIQVDDLQGTVVDFNIMNTTLEELDTRTIVTVPNRKLQDNVVTNHTRNGTRIVVIDILTSNKNKDFGAIVKIVEQAARAHPGVLATPAPVVGVASMAEVGTTVRVKVAIASSDYPGILLALKLRVRQVLASHNVELVDPF